MSQISRYVGCNFLTGKRALNVGNKSQAIKKVNPLHLHPYRSELPPSFMNAIVFLHSRPDVFLRLFVRSGFTARVVHAAVRASSMAMYSFSTAMPNWLPLLMRQPSSLPRIRNSATRMACFMYRDTRSGQKAMPWVHVGSLRGVCAGYMISE